MFGSSREPDEDGADIGAVSPTGKLFPHPDGFLLRPEYRQHGPANREKIDLWQHHRLDPDIVFETQVANILALKERGIVDQIGVSNYDAKQLEIAIKIAGGPDDGGIVSIQNEFSPRYRYDLDVLAVCEKYGVAYLPWSPLGGMNNKKAITDSDAFEEVASKHNVSKYAVALAWEIKTSPSVIPIPGATRTESILDCITALDVTLSDDEFEYLNAHLPEQAEYSSELMPKPAHR